MEGERSEKKSLEHAPYERLKWRVLRTFRALPTEARARAMTDGDYLYCALNLLLDQEETLDRLCPQCRSEAEEGRCPSCGARWSAGDGSRNDAFDEGRYEALRKGERG